MDLDADSYAHRHIDELLSLSTFSRQKVLDVLADAYRAGREAALECPRTP